MRSVRPTCASEASAGWQQVKIRRSRSSGICGRIVVRLGKSRTQFVGRVGFELLLEDLFAADAVDGLMPGGLDDPGPRKLRHSGLFPLAHGRGKGFLGALFGQVEVADQADESGHDSSPVGAVHCFDGRSGV